MLSTYDIYLYCGLPCITKDLRVPSPTLLPCCVSARGGGKKEREKREETAGLGK